MQQGNFVSETLAKIKDTTSNPAPLGLLGFGMTTVLLNIHNAGFYPLNTMILAMGIFYGGIAQVIAGIMEWKKGNTFGTTAFTSYGLFWLTLVALLMLPKTMTGTTTSHRYKHGCNCQPTSLCGDYSPSLCSSAL